MSVGSRVRTVREAKGLSQEAVAFAAGLSCSTVERVERGLGSPRVDTLQAIARALGVPAAELLEPEPERAA